MGLRCLALEEARNVPLIAIIDDQQAAVEALAELIPAATGYRAAAFTSGLAFLSSLDKELPDAIVLDLRMPPPNGMEILEELQNRRLHQIPVIVITAEGNEAMTAAVAAGATAALQKPLRLGELVALLREAIERGS